jgi:ABC-2 type transport system permease protein
MNTQRKSDLIWLFALRLRILGNQLRSAEKNARWRWLSLSVLGVLFIAGDYYFFHRIIAHLGGLPFQAGDELIPQLLNVVFLTLFVMGMFSGVIVSISLFYMAPDLEFLHALPVSTHSILSFRMITCVLHSSWMMLLFSVPIFTAYGVYYELPIGYYLYMVVALLPFLTIPCVTGALGTLLLMRYFPSRRIYQTLSLVGLMFLVGLIMYLRFLSPEKFFGKNISDEGIMLFVESLKVPDYSFLPSSWITLGLTQWKMQTLSPAFWNMAYLFLCVILLTAILRWLGDRIYIDGWRLAGEANNAPPKATISRLELEKASKKIPMHRVLWKRDIRLFFRDPEQWSQIFILCALVIVYLFNVMNLPLNNAILKNVVSVLNIGLVGFVLSALASRFIFTAPSLEGRMFWTVYSSPASMKTLLWSKFFLFFPPMLVLAELLAVATNYLLQVDSYVMIVSIIGVSLIAFAITGLALGLGALYPMFRHDNTAEISSSVGGVLFMIASLGYLGLFMALGARPVYVHFNEMFLSRMVPGLNGEICFVLVVILTLAVALIPMHKGVLALEKMDL